MEKKKTTENVKLIGQPGSTLFCVWFPVTCLLPYDTTFWLKARRKERETLL